MDDVAVELAAEHKRGEGQRLHDGGGIAFEPVAPVLKVGSVDSSGSERAGNQIYFFEALKRLTRCADKHDREIRAPARKGGVQQSKSRSNGEEQESKGTRDGLS